jgi:hypothetical protein
MDDGLKRKSGIERQDAEGAEGAEGAEEEGRRCFGVSVFRWKRERFSRHAPVLSRCSY